MVSNYFNNPLAWNAHTHKKIPPFNWLTVEVFFILFYFLIYFLQAPSCSPEEDICILLARDDVLFLRLQSHDLIIQICDLKQMKDWGFYPTPQTPRMPCCPLLLGQKTHCSHQYSHIVCFYLKCDFFFSICIYFYILLRHFSWCTAIRTHWGDWPRTCFKSYNSLSQIGNSAFSADFRLKVVNPTLDPSTLFQPIWINTFVFGNPFVLICLWPLIINALHSLKAYEPCMAMKGKKNLANLSKETMLYTSSISSVVFPM